MNIKKMKIPVILLAVTFLAYIILTLALCYRTSPTIKEGEFPFSITYEYKGEVGTLKGVYKCEFSGSRTVANEHKRYWDGETIYENPKNLENPRIIDESEYTTLAIQEHMCAGYFMGDPLYADYYETYGLDGPTPDVEYYDYKNEIVLDEENYEEILEAIDFRIVDFTYAEPIENDNYYFSGILFAADNVMAFIALSLIFLILCLILVRKDKDYKYSALDKSSIIINFVVGIIALPFISLICILYDLNGGGTDIMSQIAYNVPPVAIMCLALSVVFRRKGLRKTGFFIQFGGVALFAMLLVVEMIGSAVMALF